MLENFIISHIIRSLPFVPNEGQRFLAAQLAHFLLSTTPRKTFVLKGYAGTGKTSMIAALVHAMQQMQQNCVLLAPTGRAAKVMSRYAGTPAFTIHKWIYRGAENIGADTGTGQFRLADNMLTHTLFIVDEASMVSADRDNPVFGSGSLLDDLVRFVFSPPPGITITDSGNSLLLLGDDAQLPPVGRTASPALDPDFLGGYGLDVTAGVLTEVARQALDSGILRNATLIREGGSMEIAEDTDIHLVPPAQMQEEIERAYAESGVAETIILTRSNKRANMYNQGIRASVLWKEGLISAGDRLMVSRNNYFWTAQYDNLPFLANGDTLEVERLGGETEMYGFNFINASLRSLDYDWEIDALLWLDTLNTPSPEDNYRLYKQLYERIAEDYPEIRSRREKDRLIRQSPYLNALQIRFAYAVTCHKAQGGQWDNVFIDEQRRTQDADNEEDEAERRRWLYTALTRAKKAVFLPDFTPRHD